MFQCVIQKNVFQAPPFLKQDATGVVEYLAFLVRSPCTPIFPVLVTNPVKKFLHCVYWLHAQWVGSSVRMVKFNQHRAPLAF
jgi:hypothetical protein